MVKEFWRYVKLFWYNTGLWQMDGQHIPCLHITVCQMWTYFLTKLFYGRQLFQACGKSEKPKRYTVNDEHGFAASWWIWLFVSEVTYNVSSETLSFTQLNSTDDWCIVQGWCYTASKRWLSFPWQPDCQQSGWKLSYYGWQVCHQSFDVFYMYSFYLTRMIHHIMEQ